MLVMTCACVLGTDCCMSVAVLLQHSTGLNCSALRRHNPQALFAWVRPALLVHRQQ